MRIVGIKEEKGESVEKIESDEKIVKLFNSQFTTGSKLNDRTFERAHRIGKFEPKKTKVILVKFAHFKDKLEAFKASTSLRSENVFLADDYPEAIDRDSMTISKVHSALKLARETHASPHVQSLQKRQDKFLLNNKIYTVLTSTISTTPTRDLVHSNKE